MLKFNTDKDKKAAYQIGMLFLMVGSLMVNPQKVGNARNEIRVYSAQDSSQQLGKSEDLEKLVDKKIQEAKILNAKLDATPSKPRIIYKTKTKTVKPYSITLYIRHPDGTITEHHVKSDGGFYIVNEDDISSGDEVEIKDDTIPEHKGWLRKIFYK
jgi:hypothetical protein